MRLAPGAMAYFHEQRWRLRRWMLLQLSEESLTDMRHCDLSNERFKQFERSHLMSRKSGSFICLSSIHLETGSRDDEEISDDSDASPAALFINIHYISLYHVWNRLMTFFSSTSRNSCTCHLCTVSDSAVFCRQSPAYSHAIKIHA